MTQQTGASPGGWLMEKVVPPLLVATCLSVISSGLAAYLTVQKLSDQTAIHEREIQGLRTELASVRANNVTRLEMLEVLKRVEQQLEISMLRSGNRSAPPRLIDR